MADNESILTLDGAYGEGGGQIIRSALTLAALTGRPVRWERIRAGRKKPGLRPQHLTAVRASARICAATLTGDALDSQTLTFTPGSPPLAGDYTFDVRDAAAGGSAGAATLVLQTLLLPLALAHGPSRITLKGGTFVPWSPPAPYLEQVYLPMLTRMGVAVEFEHSQWGFYPRGGGELEVHLPGKALVLPLTIQERGALMEIRGMAFAAQLPSHIPQRMCDRARGLLQSLRTRVDIQPLHIRADSPAAGLFLLARYEHSLAGFSALGRKGLPAEEVAAQASTALLEHHATAATLDECLADQLALPLALAGVPTRITVANVTQHLLTQAWVINHFLPGTLHIEGVTGQPGALVIV